MAENEQIGSGDPVRTGPVDRPRTATEFALAQAQADIADLTERLARVEKRELSARILRLEMLVVFDQISILVESGRARKNIPDMLARLEATNLIENVQESLRGEIMKTVKILLAKGEVPGEGAAAVLDILEVYLEGKP